MTDTSGRPLNLVCGVGINPDGTMAQRMAIDGWNYGQTCKDWPGAEADDRETQIDYFVSGLFAWMGVLGW